MKTQHENTQKYTSCAVNGHVHGCFQQGCWVGFPAVWWRAEGVDGCYKSVGVKCCLMKQVQIFTSSDRLINSERYLSPACTLQSITHAHISYHTLCSCLDHILLRKHTKCVTRMWCWCDKRPTVCPIAGTSVLSASKAQKNGLKMTEKAEKWH